MIPNKRSIVVEDHDMTRVLICTALQALGIKEIVTAVNGADALARLEHRDLVTY